MFQFKKLWLYKLDRDYSYRDYCFRSEIAKKIDCDRKFPDKCGVLRLVIKTDGTITVKKGYAWDGCSPKFNILSLFWIGIPEGVLSESKPSTYYASLVHDALGQFCSRDNKPFNRRQRDLIFKKMLEDKRFQLAPIYYWAVRIFGSIYSRLTKTPKPREN